MTNGVSALFATPLQRSKPNKNQSEIIETSETISSE